MLTSVEWYRYVVVTSVERKVATAIRQLRLELRESQQQFSERLGVTVRTIARYEADRPPRGNILLRLSDIADGCGRKDLRKVFIDAEEVEVSSRVSPVAGAIRRLRYELDFTQQQLADATDLPVSAIAGAETHAYPGEDAIKKLKKIARVHKLAEIEIALNKKWDGKSRELDSRKREPLDRAEMHSQMFDQTLAFGGIAGDPSKSTAHLEGIRSSANRAAGELKMLLPSEDQHWGPERRLREYLKVELSQAIDEAESIRLNFFEDLLKALRQHEVVVFAISWLICRVPPESDASKRFEDLLAQYIRDLIAEGGFPIDADEESNLYSLLGQSPES